MTCPHCNGDNLVLLRDAYAVYPIEGVDPDYGVETGERIDVRTFDDDRIECEDCGSEFRWHYGDDKLERING